jgi:hypothetical protein
MWAKVSGNYESTEGGNSDEFFAFIAGMPSESYSTTGTSSLNKDDSKLYDAIYDAMTKGYPMAAGVGSCGGTYNSKGLVCGHAYSVL